MQKKRVGFRHNQRRFVFGAREKKRLIQLCLSVCLFLTVFWGRSNELAQANGTGNRILQLIQENTDFVGAFSALGESVSDDLSVWESMNTFAQKLFGVRTDKNDTDVLIIHDGPASLNTIKAMQSIPTQESMLHALGVVSAPKKEHDHFAENYGAAEEQEQSTAKDSVESVLPVIPEYNGPELPAHATMDYHELGLQSVITPVIGEIASPYGYRDHPINGEYTFHPGVDIAADSGTPIKAFSDGMVEYIGESDDYGLYIQLDHGNDIKTFYCHCSELLYGKGKSVTAGQTIALVGDTGNTTGSHLHLEIKREGLLLNPLYYIESIN